MELQDGTRLWSAGTKIIVGITGKSIAHNRSSGTRFHRSWPVACCTNRDAAVVAVRHAKLVPHLVKKELIHKHLSIRTKVPFAAYATSFYAGIA